MRTAVFTSFASLTLGALMLAAPATAQDAKQDFRLVNRTGYEIKDVYVSPSKSDDWGDEVLGRGNRLADGQGVNLHFNPRTRTCRWDLKVVYSVDDSKAVWSDINLCEVDKITIHYDRQNDVTRATFD